MNRPILKGQFSHGYWQIESSRACAAGIEIEYTIFHLLLRNVTVAVDDGRDSCRLRVQIETFEDMQDINRNAINFEEIGFRNILRLLSVIDVGAHNRDWSNFAQAV